MPSKLCSLESPAIKDRTSLYLFRILALGLLFRLIHFYFISKTAFPWIPLFFVQSDTNAFWQWSNTILEGDFLGENTFHPYFDWMKEIAPLETWYRWWGGKEIFQQAPLYPYWVALLRAVHDRPAFVLFVQLVVGTLQCWILFHLTNRLFDERIALVAGALAAFYAPLVFYQGTVLRDWLPALLEPLALVLILRAGESSRPADHLLAGAALGISLLAKERILLFLPVAVIWILLKHSKQVKQAAVLSFALLIGLAICLSPLVTRNVLVGAPAFSLSNRSAEGLIEGNAADSFPIGFTTPPSMKRILEKSEGRSSLVLRGVLKTYDGDWGRFFELQLLKLRAIFDPMEIPNNLNFAYGMEISPILRFSFRYGFLFPLGITGFLISLRAWRKQILFVFYSAFVLSTLLLSSISSRQRLVLVVVLMVYGAVMLVEIFDGIRTKRIAKTLSCLMIVAAFAFIQQWWIPIQKLRNNITFAIHPPEYLISAHVYALDGRLDKAIEEMERLQRKARGHENFASFSRTMSVLAGDYKVLWAERLIEEGKPAEAKRQAEEAQKAYSERPEVSSPYRRLGLLYYRLNEREKAKAFLQKFLEMEPDSKEADQIRQLFSQLQ